MKNFDKNKINQLYPGAENLMIEPMLIHKGTDSQLKSASQSGEYFAQLKKDGALYMFVKGTNGENYLFGRTVSKKTGLLTEKSANIPHIVEAFHDIPNGTVLLGEIYYPGKTSKDVTSIMGCLPQKAYNRQFKEGYGPIQYYLYDCLVYNNTSLLNQDNWTRYQVLQAIWKKKIYQGSVIPFPIELAKVYEKNIYEEVGKALAAGEEGMVFKKKTGLYSPGKRPSTMLKAKQVDYIDAVIIGFKDPEINYTGKEIETWQYWIDNYYMKPLPVGLHYKEKNAAPVTKHYYFGWKNAIEIGAYDEQGQIHSIGTIASGLTDAMREDMSINSEKYLYKTCEIQCMMKDNKEKTLRHGFFLQMREDKPATDCLLSEIFQ